MMAWVQAIAGNLFVACLIGGLAWLAGRSGRRARLAHTLWLLFFVKLITPPIIALPVHVPEQWLAWAAHEVTRDAPADAAVPERVASLTATGIAAEASRAPSVLPRGISTPSHAHSAEFAPRLAHYALALWMAGFLWIFGRGLLRALRFRRLLQETGVPDAEATHFVGQLLSMERERNGKGRNDLGGPQVLRIPLRVSPMLFGLGRRCVIVCPDLLWKSLSEGERRAFLAHEAAHYCRRDHWVRWLEWSVTAIYWWFPVLYVARWQLERHEEACCDAWAVDKLGSPPRQYAEALLRVVDFISEFQVGIPRLASGMQPTGSLEERLHRVMKGTGTAENSKALRWSVSTACISLWLVHPVIEPYRGTRMGVAEATRQERPPALTRSLPDANSVSPSPTEDVGELPEPPAGYWNRPARRQWADVSLTLPGVRLVAEADEGIRFQVPGQETLQFSANELSAVAEIPATQRVVIGDAAGRLRLWDLTAGMPVSLIGVHPSSVVSLAYHEAAGLVSADQAGSVMRWNLQSGQVLATWSDSAGPVQSVRFANDGQTVAILRGEWKQVGDVQTVEVVDSRTLQSQHSWPVAAETAVVLQSATGAWLAVDWSGSVYSLSTHMKVGEVPKHHVSALVLCQEAPLSLTQALPTAAPFSFSTSSVSE